ncbi:MAG TPA: class I SAM-dependent methyltransferase [Solirubrobacteraceae bacterium]|nr:class I SAM-dependent methyltransferase [Solirubrobacteraceae bacterium]
MNGAHHLICSSRWWARGVEGKLIPWGLRGIDLGEEVLEVGPGFGATTRVLARRPGRLTALELEEGYCERLRRELGGEVTVVQGDATRMDLPDGRFSGAVCFTMLHHVPSRELQDRLLAEVARVLRPGGRFAGTDSLGEGLLFKAIHAGETLNLVDPEGLPGRLERAGFVEPVVETAGRSLRFRARKPE